MSTHGANAANPDDAMMGVIPELPPAADEHIFDDAEEARAQALVPGAESAALGGEVRAESEGEEDDRDMDEVEAEVVGAAGDGEAGGDAEASDAVAVADEVDGDEAEASIVGEDSAALSKKEGEKEEPTGKPTPRRKGRRAKAATEEKPKPKRRRGRPRKSEGDASLKIDVTSGTVSYGRRKLKAPSSTTPRGMRAPPPHMALPPHMMMAAPWAAGWFPQPYPFAPPAGGVVELPPRPGPPPAESPAKPPPQGPFKRFYAIRKSARGCPVPVKNCLFTSWDDCKPFIRPKETAAAAKGGGKKKSPAGKGKKKGKGRPKKAEKGVEESEEPEEGEDGKAGRAEFGVFDTPGEAFMYLAAGTKEGAAAMASVAALKAKLPEPPKAKARSKKIDKDVDDDAEEKEEEKREIEKGEGDDEGEEGAEDSGWLRVYDGEKGEAPPVPKRKRNSEDGKSPARKRGRPKKEDGDGETPGKKSPGSTANSPRSAKPRYLTKKWLGMLDRLRAYKEEHGTSSVPTNCRDELYKWVREQRVQHKALLEKGPEKSGMHEEKIKLLRELDFDFAKPEQDDPQTGEVRSSRPLSEKWLAMLERARLFKEQHGNFEKLDSDKNLDLELFGWIREQRYYHKIRFDGSTKNKDNSRLARVMHDEKIRRLEEIGFDFTAKEVAREKDWEDNFEELKRFKAEHGHCNVPLSKKGEVRSRFQTWCVQQRIEYKNLRDGKKTRMTLERMTRLNDVGFAFLTRERYVNWETRMEQTRQFAAENGHCNIPVDHPLLGEFTCKMRRHYKLYLDGKPCSINPHKIEQLNSVGFVWLAGKRWTTKIVRKSWEERFSDLLEYKQVHGHTNVPQSYPGLGVWVKEQRKEYKKMVKGISKAKMSAEKALRLSEVGFLFEIRTGAPGGRRSGVGMEPEPEPPEPQEAYVREEPQQEAYVREEPQQVTQEAYVREEPQQEAYIREEPQEYHKDYSRDYSDYQADVHAQAHAHVQAQAQAQAHNYNKDYTAFQARYSAGL